MQTLEGYSFQEILYSSPKTLVYRATREADERSVIIKSPQNEYPGVREYARFQREYEIGNKFRHEHIVKPITLEQKGKNLALVLEDIHGESLANFINRNEIDLKTKIAISILLTEAVAVIHENGVIHLDLKPDNIIFNSVTGQLEVIDFDISTSLSRDHSSRYSIHHLEGTLHYISPEQTGRINRGIDSRSDLYSLGVTFYEIFTKKLPFTNEDKLDLIHSHIAVIPEPPSSLNSEIPAIISEIIMKLLAKEPEDRYKTAKGLKSDLERCLTSASISIDSLKNLHFTPGETDFSDKFSIPQKLYGRENELNILSSAIAGINKNKDRLILVSGNPGTGKSALLHEIKKPVAGRKGYFLPGKFDQFQRNIPYYAIREVFESFITQILLEPTDKLNLWKETLKNAVGLNGGILKEIIPRIELIIGESSPVKVDLKEAENRFYLVLKSFIKAILKDGRPICILIDDLQWADSASLVLIKNLAKEEDFKNLLVLGTYRDNEIISSPQLSIFLDEIEKESISHLKIHILDLEKKDLESLLNESLFAGNESISELTDLVYNKTAGNAFFINQFLENLYKEDLLNPPKDASSGWTWDIQKIREKDFTSNVIDFLITRFSALSDETIHSIKTASVLGNKFHIRILSEVLNKTIKETLHLLWPAIQENLLYPISETYKDILVIETIPDELDASFKFTHDKLQLAANTLLSEEEIQSLNLKTGKLLFEQLQDNSKEDEIFQVAAHFNLAKNLIKEDRLLLIDLNRKAGIIAKSSMAFEPAYSYFKSALEQINENDWDTHYHSTLHLYIEAAEAAYLCSDFTSEKKLTNVAERKIEEGKSTITDEVKIFNIRISSLLIQGLTIEAISKALVILKKLGIDFPDAPGPADIGAAIGKTAGLMKDKDIIDIINNPVMQDEGKIHAMRILAKMIPPAFMVYPQILPLVILEQVNLSLIYGNAPSSHFAFANYALLQTGILKDYASGYETGRIALKLLEQSGDKEFKAKTLFTLGSFVNHWKVHLNKSLELYQEGLKSAFEVGDLEFAGYIMSSFVGLSLFIGEELSASINIAEKNYEQLNKINAGISIQQNRVFHQTVYNLYNEIQNPEIFKGPILDDSVSIPEYIENKHFNLILYNFLCKIFISIMFRKFKEAEEFIEKSIDFLPTAPGHPLIPFYYLYGSIAIISNHTKEEIGSNKVLEERLNTWKEQLKEYSESAPENCKHKYYLLLAINAELENDTGNAVDFYSKAIESAGKNHYIHEQAIACEFFSEFWKKKRNLKIEKLYKEEALLLYEKWGAKGKASLLRAEILEPQQFQVSSGSNTTNSDIKLTETTSSELIDMKTVIQASREISGEVKLDSLLTKLLTLVIKNAGAEKGLILIPDNDLLYIEAEGRVNQDTITLQSVLLKSDSKYPVNLINYVARTKTTVILDDAKSDSIFSIDPYIRANDTLSVLCTPLINSGKLVGIIYLENNLSKNVFTADRLEVIRILSLQAAISIENAKLYTNLVKFTREKVQLETEIQIAQEIQLALLPKHPKLEGFEVTTYMKTAESVGGDYFDVIHESGRDWLVIGDVSGHGLASGLVMMMTQSAIHTAVQFYGDADLRKILQAVNKTISTNVRTMLLDKYITLTLLVRDSDNSFLYSGKHMDILIFSMKERKVKNIPTRGSWIGFAEKMNEFFIDSLSVEKGDILLLYSDGLTEARDRNNVMMDEEVFYNIIFENMQKPTEQIKDAILDLHKNFINKDDVTFMVLKKI